MFRFGVLSGAERPAAAAGGQISTHERQLPTALAPPLPTALAQPGPDQTLRLRAQGSLETPSRPRTGGTRAPHTGTPAGRGSWIYAHACSSAAITCRPRRAVRAPVSKGMVRAAGKQSRLASYDGAQRGKEALAAFWAQDGQPASASSPLSFCIFSMAPLVVGALLVPCCPLRAWRAAAHCAGSRSAQTYPKSIHRFPRAHVMTNQMDTTVQGTDMGVQKRVAEGDAGKYNYPSMYPS